MSECVSVRVKMRAHALSGNGAENGVALESHVRGEHHQPTVALRAPRGVCVRERKICRRRENERQPGVRRGDAAEDSALSATSSALPL